MADADSREHLARLLGELLAGHGQRFKAAHERARSGAGPSIFGSDRSVEHWTFGYARRAVEECFGDAAVLVLTFAHERGLPPDRFEALARKSLTGYLDGIIAALKADRERAPGNEFGLRPAREALSALEATGRQTLQATLASIARGKVDERIVPRAGLASRLARAAGGADRLILVSAVALFVLLMALSL